MSVARRVGRALAKEVAEQSVEHRLLAAKFERRDEEGLGGDREEFLDRLGTVRVEKGLLAGVDLLGEAPVFDIEASRPRLACIAVRPACRSSTWTNSWITTL